MLKSENLYSRSKLLAISISRVAIGIFPMLGNLYVGRILIESEFGSYFLFYFLSTFILSFYGLNIHSGYRRHVSSKTYYVKLNGFLSAQLFLTFIAIFNTFILFFTYFLFKDTLEINSYYFLALTFFCFSSVFIAMFESFSIVTESFKFYIFNILLPVPTAWFFSIIYMQLTNNWIDRYLSYSIFLIIYLIISIFLFIKNVPIRNLISMYIKRISFKFLRISIYLLLPVLLIQALNYFDKLVIESLLNKNQFGQYSLVIQFTLIPFMAFKVIEMLYEKILFEKIFYKNYFFMLYVHILVYSLIHIIIAAAISILMPYIFDIVFLKELNIDRLSVFLATLAQMSKLAFNFLIIYLLFIRKQNYAITHACLFFLLWILAILISDSANQYLVLSILFTYLSVGIIMFTAKKKSYTQNV